MLWIACVMASAPGFGQAADTARRVTLKECLAITLQQHPNSTIYQNQVSIAQQKVKENRAAFLPAVTANANTDYNLKLQTSVIPAGTFGPEETRLQMGNKFSSGASVQADLTLIDQSSRYSIKSAKVDQEVASLNALKENENLLYNTASAYYQVLTYQEKGRLLRDNEKQYVQLLDILRLQYSQGVAKKTAYNQARVNLSNIQAELALNQSNLQLAMNKLKNAMGVNLDLALSIADTISYNAPTQRPVWGELNTQSLLAYQIDQRNTLLKEIDVRKKQAAFLPTLSIYGKYGATAFGKEFSTAYQKWFDYSAVGVKVSIPLFSGFKKSSQLTQSRLTLDNQRLTAKLNHNTYQLDYQNSGTQLLSSYTSLEKNKENLGLAREVLSATAVEYQQGTADLSAFLDADKSYKEAQSNYTTSLLDFLTSQLAYEKAKGTLTDYIQKLQ